jgi:hypothetical protein
MYKVIDNGVGEYHWELRAILVLIHTNKIGYFKDKNIAERIAKILNEDLFYQD